MKKCTNIKKKNKLILLGTKGGPAVYEKNSMPSSNLLLLDGKYILIDCGLGVSKRLLECNVDLKKIDIILISHLHSDHMLELGPLLHTIWTLGNKKRIRIFGPEGLEKYIFYFFKSMKKDIRTRMSHEGREDIKKSFVIKILKNGLNFNKRLKILAIRVKHPPFKNSFAFKIIGSKKIIFSGDTTYYPPIINFSQNSDILVHEALIENQVDKIVKRTMLGKKLKKHLINSHTPIEKVFEIAEKAKVKKLIINHLVPSLSHSEEWEKVATLSKSYNNFKTILGVDKLKITI